MSALTPHNWRTGIVNIAISALVVAIALHIAVDLVRNAIPELITSLVVILSVYAAWTLVRIRRSRW